METSPGGDRTAPGWAVGLAALAAAACVLGLGAVRGADAMANGAGVALLLAVLALLIVRRGVRPRYSAGPLRSPAW